MSLAFLFTLAVASALLLASCSQPTPPDVWAQVRAAMPSDIAVYKPGRVPTRFGAPTVLEATNDAGYGPRYTIHYSAGDLEHLVLTLGIPKGAFGNTGPPDGRESVPVLGFEASLLSTSTGSPRYDIAWREQEGTRVYTIRFYSQRATRAELMQVADSLAAIR